MLEAKKTTKKDILVKKCYLEDGVVYDTEEGTVITLLETIEKEFGSGNDVKITVTATTSEDIEVETTSDSE